MSNLKMKKEKIKLFSVIINTKYETKSEDFVRMHLLQLCEENRSNDLHL